MKSTINLNFRSLKILVLKEHTNVFNTPIYVMKELLEGGGKKNSMGSTYKIKLNSLEKIKFSWTISFNLNFTMIMKIKNFNGNKFLKSSKVRIKREILNVSVNDGELL